jgi:hypothetical protein
MTEVGITVSSASFRPALRPSHPHNKWVQGGWAMKLTAHLHLVTRLIMRGALPSLLFFIEWCLIRYGLHLHGVVLS